MEVLTRLRCGALAVALALAATPAAAADAKVLRVGTSGDYAPFSFSTKGSDSEPDGFDLAVAREFARERGYTLKIVRFKWPDLARELAAGSFDVVMSGVTVRAERSVSGRYSVPVAATHAVALSWRGSGSSTKQELDRPDHRIAVNAGGHLEQVAREVFTAAAVTALPDNDAVRMALLDRSFDAVITDDFEQRSWVEGARDVVTIGPLSDDRKAYWLPPGSDALAAELDRFLVERERDGTLSKLRARWLGEGAATMTTAEPVAALASAAAERLALMPFVYDAKQKLGKRIEDPAQETAVVEASLRTLADTATATGAAPVDAAAAGQLFQALMDMSKDLQRQLFERDGHQRAGVVVHTGPDGSTATEVTKLPENEAAMAAARPATAKPAPRSFDLANELRPAIARITEKIARLLLMIDRPVTPEAARAAVEAALAPRGVRADRTTALADAIVAVSAARGTAHQDPDDPDHHRF